MKIKQKSRVNHKYNRPHRILPRRDVDRRIFYAITAIMIFMNPRISVNASMAVLPASASPTSPLTELPTREQTWTLWPEDGIKMPNPIIAQQSSKTSAPQKPKALVSSNNYSSSTITTSFLAMENINIETQAVNAADFKPKPLSINSNRHSLSNSLPTTTLNQNQGNCKSLTSTWGDVDPNIYYLCDMQTLQPVPLRCPEGRGYFHGLGYMGCIPFEEWPACLPPGAHEQVHVCDSEHMQQPWETMNPNKFYICLQEAIEPMLLNCGQGKGFLHVHISGVGGTDDTGADSEIVGCANWEKWRSYMQCTDYY